MSGLTVLQGGHDKPRFVMSPQDRESTWIATNTNDEGPRVAPGPF